MSGDILWTANFLLARTPVRFCACTFQSYSLVQCHLIFLHGNTSKEQLEILDTYYCNLVLRQPLVLGYPGQNS